MATSQRLYNLLPAIYRRRDTEQGEPLKALMGAMEAELEIFEEDLGTLYDNWFIETCEEWAVPYIGDLLGLKGLYPGIPGIFSQRAFVANTLAFRRRKGTTMVLEQLARDATGWPTKVVEFFELMGATQNINHPRIGKGGTALIRDANRMDLVHTAFDTSAHTADVRRGATGTAGTYNIPNVGIYVWPLPSYFIRESQPRENPTDSDCFTFHALGIDLPLFNVPQTEEDISSFAGEINLPTPLRRRSLYDETELLRDPTADVAARPVYFVPGDEVFSIQVNGTAIPPGEILIADLRDWTKPEPTKTYTYFENGSEQNVQRTITVAVDPVLGRLAFPDGLAPAAAELRVNYAYGFIGDIGGGPYNRRASVSENLATTIDWQAGVSENPTPVSGEELYATLGEAIAAWNALPAGAVGLITVMDSRTYAEDLTAAGSGAIEIKEGSSLMIVAADWPIVGVEENVSSGERKNGRIVPAGIRPHLKGDIAVQGTAPAESLTPGALIIDGLLIEGDCTALAGNLGRLRIAHTTLAKIDGVGGALTVQANPIAGEPGTYNENLTVAFERSVARHLDLSATVAQLLSIDSIVHNTDGPIAINAGKTRADIRSTTLVGETHLRAIEGENSIFMNPLYVERRQSGCVRYCSLHEDSQTPRRFRCQPDLAIQLKNSDEPSPHDGFSDALTRERVRPTFASKSPFHPAYLRLRTEAPAEVRTGAEDGSEMGALFHLKQAQREANLRTNLNEYLRFGKEVGVFFVVPNFESL